MTGMMDKAVGQSRSAAANVIAPGRRLVSVFLHGKEAPIGMMVSAEEADRAVVDYLREDPVRLTSEPDASGNVTEVLVHAPSALGVSRGPVA